MAQAPMSAVDASTPHTIDVTDFIDRHPVSRFQISILLVCMTVLFIDGFDTQAIGYVAPAVAQDWHLMRGALGPVFSAGLFGLMIGALIFGPVADHIGRRLVIIISTAAFALGSLATIFAYDLDSLFAIRFLTGLGLGGAMPNAIALTSEFSPHRRRATMVMSMFAGFSIGAAVGGILAAALIPSFGWRSVFLVGGLAPLFLLPFLIARLPESIRFLALTGKSGKDAAALLARIAPSKQFPEGVRLVVREARVSGIPVAHLFAKGRRLATTAFWILFFMSLLDLYLLSNWLPTILNDLGASISTASIIGAMLQVGGFIGVFTLGLFVDRFSFRALALTYFGATLAIAAIGFAGHSIVPVTIAIFCAGFCIVGGQTASNALAATFYPTAIRSTGVGWSLGIGRIGSIVGPLIGGVILSRQVGAEKLFVAAAIPAFCAALAAVALSRLTADMQPAAS